MARTIEEINQEYSFTASKAGEKDYYIFLKTQEISDLEIEKEKLLNKMKNLSREAHAVLRKEASPETTTTEQAATTTTTETTTQTTTGVQ